MASVEYDKRGRGLCSSHSNFMEDNVLIVEEYDDALSLLLRQLTQHIVGAWKRKGCITQRVEKSSTHMRGCNLVVNTLHVHEIDR